MNSGPAGCRSQETRNRANPICGPSLFILQSHFTLGKVELGVVMVPPRESEESPVGPDSPVVMEGGLAKAGEGKGEGRPPADGG